MKKRIIAALTALVMVVTMIPASAFAATAPTPKTIDGAIKTLVGSFDGNAAVAYTQEELDALDKILVDYESLNVADKNTVNDANGKYMYAAMGVMKAYCNDIKAYKDAVNNLTGLTADGNKIKVPATLAKAIDNLAATEVKMDVDAKAGTVKLNEKGSFTIKKDDLAKTKTTALKFDKLKSSTLKAYLGENNLDRTAEDALIKMVYAVTDFTKAGSDDADANFVAFLTAAAKDMELDTYNETTTAAHPAYALVKAVYGDDLLPGGKDGAADVTFVGSKEKIADYVYLAADKERNNFLAAFEKASIFENGRKAFAEAKKALEDPNGDEDKADSYLASYTTINTATTKFDEKTNKLPNVNVNNITEVKAAYEKALKVYTDNKDIFTTEAETYRDNVLSILQPVKKEDGKFYTATENGMIDVVEAAVANKAIIDELSAKIAKKEALTMEDVLNFNRIENIKIAGDATPFTKINAFDNIDAFLAVSPREANELKVYNAYNAVAKEVTAAKANFGAKEIAAKYAPAVKEALKAVPSFDTITLNDVAKIDAVIDAINNYITAMKTFDKASGLVNKDAIIAEKDYTLTNLTDTDAYLELNGITKNDILAFKDSANQIGTIEKAYDSAITTVESALTKAIAYLKATEADSIVSGKEYENAKTDIVAYDEAFAELDKVVNAKDVKAHYAEKNKADLEKLAKVRKYMVRFESIKEVVADLDANVAPKLGQLKLVRNGNMTAADYTANKAIIDSIATTLAKENYDYIFRHYDSAQKDIAGASKAYDFARYDAAVIEYNAYMADGSAATVENKIAALKPLAKTAKFADIDAAIAAYTDVKAAYDALDNAGKAAVNNVNKLTSIDKGIKDALVREISGEMAKLVKIPANNVLTASQVKTVEAVNALLVKYEENLGKAIYDSKQKATSAAGGNVKKIFPGFANNPNDPAYIFAEALYLVENKTADAAKAEIEKVYTTIEEGYNVVAGSNVIDNAKEAELVIKAIAAYNGLSDLAKEMVVEPTFTITIKGASKTNFDKIYVEKMLASEKEAKSYFLENATVAPITDQDATGEYVRPEIVITDAMGNVVDAKEYTVEYFNNLKAGTAKFVATAVTGSKYVGSIEGTFKILADKLVAPTGLKVVASDNGILKIECDAVEGVQYKFFVRKIGNTKWSASKIKDAPTVTYTGLTKNAQYEVKAVTVLNGEESDITVMDGTVWTNRIGTRSAYMYKPAIKNVTIKNRVAKVTVKTVNYNNVKYALGFKKANAKEFRWFAPNAKTVKTVKNLKKGVKYTFAIRYQYTSEVSNTIVKNPKVATATRTVK